MFVLDLVGGRTEPACAGAVGCPRRPAGANSHGINLRTLSIIQGTFGIIQITFGNIQVTFGIIRGTFGILQGTSGIIQGTNGIIQGTFGVIQGTFSVIQGIFGVIQGTFGIIQRTIGIILRTFKPDQTLKHIMHHDLINQIKWVTLSRILITKGGSEVEAYPLSSHDIS
jgi:hypothetical protein